MLFSSCFSDYRYKKDELFKRLKVTTFAQLVSWRPSRWSLGCLLCPFLQLPGLGASSVSRVPPAGAWRGSLLCVHVDGDILPLPLVKIVYHARALDFLFIIFMVYDFALWNFTFKTQKSVFWILWAFFSVEIEWFPFYYDWVLCQITLPWAVLLVWASHFLLSLETCGR